MRWPSIQSARTRAAPRFESRQSAHLLACVYIYSPGYSAPFAAPTIPSKGQSTQYREASYILPHDAIRLRTDDARIVSLADRLWDPAPEGAPRARPERAPIVLTIDVSQAEAGTPPAGSLDERWTIGADDAELYLGEQLWARIDCGRGTLDAHVSSVLVAERPSLVARLLLETPAGALLARRAYGVVHAGAVVGPAGAVVIRGAPGAGKSTLVAALHRAGLGVLGDETVLAARNDPDELLAAVRDVTLLPSAARLLDLEDAVTPAGTSTEEKYRLDLFASSAPAARRARRAAAVLLGPRNGGPARLDPLAPGEFLEDFRRGEIQQERWSGTPQHIAAHWAERGAYRLSGAVDLAGAVSLLQGLVA